MKTLSTSGAFINDGILQKFNDSKPICSKSSPVFRKLEHIAKNYVLITKRMQLAILTCLGLVISFSVRCNMGVVVVALTTETIIENENGEKTIIPAKVNWSDGEIAALHSSFFWGYMLTQIPAGYLSAKFPSNRVFGLAIFVSSALNYFIPIAINTNFISLLIIRIIQGLVDGIAFPSVHGIWRYWAPPQERSRLATISFTGIYAGAIIGFPLSGYMIKNVSWMSSFYVYAAAGTVWFFAWFLISAPSPDKCLLISDKEKKYIKESINLPEPIRNAKEPRVPFCAILTSMPVWAIIVANFCRNWAFFMVTTYQATFFVESFKFDLKESNNQYISSLPHLVMAFSCISGGQLADLFRRKLKTTTVRKIMTCGGLGMEAICFIVIAFVNVPVVAIFFLVLGVGFSGFSISGYNVNQLDISPRYSTVITGISNSIGSMAGILCPIVVESLTPNQSRLEWSNVFLLLSGVHLCGITFYSLFASSEKASWSEPTEEIKAEVILIIDPVNTNSITDTSHSREKKITTESENQLDSICSINYNICFIDVPNKKESQNENVVVS